MQGSTTTWVLASALLVAAGCDDGEPTDAGASGSDASGAETTGLAESSGGVTSGGDSGTSERPPDDGSGDEGPAEGSSDGGESSAGDTSTDDTEGGGDAVLPDDPAVFGAKVTAMYIFAEPYVTVEGMPPAVTRVVNAANPGTHDVEFDDPSQRPLWIADCGEDAAGASVGCARFDGLDDYGIAGGLSIVTGDRPSMLMVARMNEVPEWVGVPFTLTDDDDVRFMNLPEVRSDVWRYNGHFTATPHNIDFGTPDLELHLHESHLASPHTLAIFDGEVQPQVGGDSTLEGPITRVSLGRRAPLQYAACDLFEAIVVDQPTLDEAQAYRELRVRAVYPELGL